jgi:drug/metabolite transporter (DMT)-like permease
MVGFLYAFAAAFFASTSDALCKKALYRHTALLTAWVRFAYATPFLAVWLLVVDLPRVDQTFWVVIVALVPLEILAVCLYMRALQISPLSLTVPFLALTPAFTLASSLVLVGEFPDRSGLAGILLIVLGAYLLNVHLTRQGVLEPLRAIVRERGSFLMIGVSFLYSITANLGKLAVQHSSAGFMSMVYFPILSLAFVPLLLMARVRISDLRAGGAVFLLIGASQAIMAFCHFHAVALILVSYLISVKRLSLVLSVLIGKVFFHETHMRERILGSCMMLCGVLLILL